MKLSIIIPCYNVENYLHSCISTLLNQQEVEISKDYELIFINDASTDNSLNLIKELTADVSGVLIINQLSNRGLSATRNNGISNSKGEYVWCVDSDDMIDLHTVKDIITTIELNPEFDGVHIYGCNVSSDSEPSNITRLDSILHKSYAWCYIVKRAFLKKFNIEYCKGLKYVEDVLFINTCLFWGARFKDVSLTPLYFYRANPNSIMHTLNLQLHYQNTLICLNEYLAFKQEHGKELRPDNLKHLNSCIHWATANVLADAMRIGEPVASKIVLQFTEDGLFPYPILWKRLSLKFGFRSLLVNIFHLPLCFPFYYRACVKFFQIKRH